MTSILRISSTARLALVAILGIAASSCAVQNQPTPDLSGPSELGLALAISAAPEVLPRDGSSMSTITVNAFDSTGKRIKQRVMLTATAGTLSVGEVMTNDTGNAPLVTYIAPGLNERVTTTTISAIPIGVAGGNAAGSNARTIRINVLGPDVPFASFTFAPSAPAVLDSITFDASTTGLGGVRCGSACNYHWDFDDGSSADGLKVVKVFSSSKVFNVTLTVTAIATGTSNSSTQPVVVAAPALPVAEFAYGTCATPALRCVRFNDASTVGAGASITGWLFDFGDSTSPSTNNPVEHTYTVAGTYTVKLTVTDSLGRTSKVTSKPVTVP